MKRGKQGLRKAQNSSHSSYSVFQIPERRQGLGCERRPPQWGNVKKTCWSNPSSIAEVTWQASKHGALRSMESFTSGCVWKTISECSWAFILLRVWLFIWFSCERVKHSQQGVSWLFHKSLSLLRLYYTAVHRLYCWYELKRQTWSLLHFSSWQSFFFNSNGTRTDAVANAIGKWQKWFPLGKISAQNPDKTKIGHG